MPPAETRKADYASLAKKYGWLIVVLAGLIPYLTSFDGGFVFDDIPLVLEDESYEKSTAGDCWRRTFWRQEFSQGLYRPITTFSYWLNIHLTGKYPPAFRTFNILLNIAVSLVLLALLRRMGLGTAVSLVAASFYALHPLHTEAVIPAFGRAELLCAFFVFAGLYFHTFPMRSFLASFAGGICVLMAFWSKEHGIILIPLCIAYDILLRHRSGRTVPREILARYLTYATFFFPAALSRICVTGGFFPHMRHFDPLGDNALALCSVPVRAATAIWLQGVGILKFFLPVKLSHDYSYAQILPFESAADPRVIVTILATGALVAGMLLLFRRRRREIALLIAFYGISILPTSNILTPTGTIFAERLFYISTAWLCALLFVAIRESFRGKSRIFLYSAAILALVFGARTWARAADWKDQESICRKGIETSPQSSKMWNNFAVELARKGDFREAILACDKAIGIYPLNKTMLKNRAFYNIKLGNFADARKDLEKIVELDSRNPEVFNKLGGILANEGELEKARKCWMKSLELCPEQTIIREALKKLEAEIAAGENEKSSD